MCQVFGGEGEGALEQHEECAKTQRSEGTWQVYAKLRSFVWL